jgi:hypothetical protein
VPIVNSGAIFVQGINEGESQAPATKLAIGAANDYSGAGGENLWLTDPDGKLLGIFGVGMPITLAGVRPPGGQLAAVIAGRW